MAGPARWYLAGLAMFSLSLVAAHFAVQEHVQKQMQQTVQRWLQRDGGSVQHVRYRLLRGALTLDQVHWIGHAGSGLALDVSHVFIKTSSRAMAKASPFFPQLQLEHPVLRIPRTMLLDWLRGAPGTPLDSLAALLPSAKFVLVRDMRLKVTSQGTGQRPRIETIRQVEGSFTPDGLELNGITGGGVLLLDGHRDSAGRLLAHLQIHDVGMDALAIWLGRSASRDVSTTGNLQLSGDWTTRDIAAKGVLQLRSSEGNASVAVQGGWSESGMNMDLACQNVALAELPFGWPGLAGRAPVAGSVNGTIHVSRDRKKAGWHIGMDGELDGLQLEATGLPAWHIKRLQLGKAQLLPQGGGWRAAAVLMDDADIVMNAAASPDAQAISTLPEITKLTLQHIRPVLRFADGAELSLPEIEGTGSLGRQSHLSLSSTTPGSDATDDQPGENWKVQANGDFLGDWHASLTAGHVSVVRLRPLLPKLTLPGQQGIPDYSGDVDLNLHLTSVASVLHVAGQAIFHNIQMVQGGDQFNVPRIDVDIADAASNGSRKLSRVRLKDWQYLMAIRPLSRIPEAATSGQDVAMATASQPEQVVGEDVSPAEQPAVRTPLNWEVDDLSAEGGRISLGQPNALVAEHLSLHARHLASGSLSPFTVSGSLGEGVLRSHGRWQLQPEFRMVSKSAIYHALPFFLNEWMRLSGMPHFVRGRLDADLHIDAPRKKGQPPDDHPYAGRLYLSLRQGELSNGVFPNDPMLQRTGYSTQALLDRLNHARKITLRIPFQGHWDRTSLGATLGTAMLGAMKHAANQAHATGHAARPPISKVTGIRLQGKSGFSQNERVRLRHMIKYLLENPKLIVVLTPELGTAPLDDAMVARVRFSQRLVEQFMRRRGIGSDRIYPVWPQAVQQQGDASGILLRARVR